MELVPRNTNAYYFLFVILTVAGILRFIHIDQPFIDMICWRQSSNAMMAENFYRKDWNIFYPEINWHGPGPSYNGRELQTVTYIAALCYNVVGEHEWVGRSVAVFFGLLGIFSLYQLVRRVWDEDRALMSAAVLAIMPGTLFIDRSFLPDPAMVALVTTSFWMLVAYLQTDRKVYLILTGIIGSLGFLTKLPGLIVGLPMVYVIVVYLLRQKKLISTKALNLVVVGFLGLLPVLFYYLWARHLSQTYPPYHFAGSGNWVWDDGLRKWLHNRYFIDKLIDIFELWFWTIPIIILVVMGLVFPPMEADLLKNDKHSQAKDDLNKLPWTFHWWIIAFGIFYLIGAKELINNPWNFHIINPAAAALAGHAITLIFVRWRSMTSKWIASTGLVFLFLVILWFGKDGLKWAYKPYALTNQQLGHSLQKISKPNDLVVTLENPIGAPVAIHYSQRRGWIFPSADTDYWGSLPEDDKIAIQMFEDLRSKGADWMGIILEQKEDIFQQHSTLFHYIDSTCILKEKNTKWMIYKILTPDELAKQTIAGGYTVKPLDQ